MADDVNTTNRFMIRRDYKTTLRSDMGMCSTTLHVRCHRVCVIIVNYVYYVYYANIMYT